MTTRIHDPEQGSYLPTYVDLTATGNTVTVRASNGLMAGTANRASNGLMAGTAKVDRADFLRAVATELDVIVIPRTDLPTPVPHPTNPDLAYVRTLTASRGRTAQSPDVLMDRALDYIAAAEWAAAEPPVDEAQVNALARLVAAETNGTHIPATALARRLIQAGVRMDGAR